MKIWSLVEKNDLKKLVYAIEFYSRFPPLCMSVARVSK